MNVIVNGRKAWIKKGSSFTLVFENRAFTDADGYSFNIIFPIAGCPDNIKIFGHLNRSDVDNPRTLFDCEISYLDFTLTGALIITGMNDTEITAQFLEGRSEQNFDDTFDDIYINELDLGSYPLSTLPNEPVSQWQGLYYGQEAVALPWVNNTSGNIQNEVVYADGAYSYHEDCSGLSYQPYLIVIVKRICAALGYDYDVSQWDGREDLRYLLICNTLPWAWDIPQFARALPHWSVTEFFEKLEYFLGCEFDIDHRNKSIKFSFTSNILTNAQSIKIDKVVDSYTAEVSDTNESNYIEASNVRYKECEHNMWKFYCCPWLLRDTLPVVYETLSALISATKSFARVRSYGRGSNIHKIFYAKDVDTYFIIRCIRNEYVGTNALGRDIYDRICVLQPINQFGDKIVDENNEDAIELDFVPAWIDETETSKGNCLFLNIAGYEEDNADSTAVTRPDDSEDTAAKIYQPNSMQRLQNGELTEKSEYFDKIFLAFWDGVNYNIGKLPCPNVDHFVVREDWTAYNSTGSLRLHANVKYKINPKQKYNFSFISNTIPNVRSVFHINGRKYLCEKITATFTENGMSQLLKGCFYLLYD